MSISLLFAIIIVLMAAAAPYAIRSVLWNRFMKYLNKEQYEQAISVLQSRAYKTFFGEYTQNWNELKVLIQMKDENRMTQKVNEMLASKLSKDQRHQVADSVYFYYLDTENKEMSRKILDQLSLCCDSDQQKYNQYLYDVLIDKNSKDLKEMLEILDKKSDQKAENGILQYLVGLQYYYQNNRKQAHVYLNRAKENLKGTPYHNKIKKLMSQERL